MELRTLTENVDATFDNDYTDLWGNGLWVTHYADRPYLPDEPPLAVAHVRIPTAGIIHAYLASYLGAALRVDAAVWTGGAMTSTTIEDARHDPAASPVVVYMAMSRDHTEYYARPVTITDNGTVEATAEPLTPRGRLEGWLYDAAARTFRPPDQTAQTYLDALRSAGNQAATL